MRNDDNEIDLSRHKASRLPGILVIVAALGVAAIAAWVFTPMLMSKDSAATAGLFNKTKPRPAAQDQQTAQPAPAAPTLASAQSTPAAPTAPAKPDAATADQTATGSLGPAVASAGPSVPLPQDRSIQVATATPAVTPDVAPEAAAEPADTPAEPFDNVPLPRKRPSRLIAASMTIPLPRPRPEIEPDAPAGPTAFDLQVERMR
jgi:hypothetical protein